MRSLGFTVLLLAACGRSEAPSPRSTDVSELRARIAPGEHAISIANDFTVETRELRAALPSHARAPMRLAVDAEHWLEIVADGAHDPPARREDGALRFAGVDDHVDAVYLAFANKIEDVRVLQTKEARTTFRWRFTRGPGIASLRLREDRIEALDANGSARLRTEPIYALDADRKQVPVSVRLDGDTLTVSVDGTGHAYPIALDPAWSTAKPMITLRLDHSAHRLPSGKVVVIGGRSVDTAFSTVEIYDPVAETWTAGASMKTARYKHVSTVMPDGKIVAAGGYVTGGGITPTTEVYDPTTDTWTTAGNFANAYVGRACAFASKIGRLLCLGGTDGGFAVTGGGSYFDGSIWTAGPGLVSARANASAIAISATEILVCGGGTTSAIDTCEVWSSEAAVKNTGAMLTQRRWFPMALVSGGTKVIAAGGAQGNELLGTTTAEIYDIASGTWSKLPTMLAPHAAQTATVLPGDRVLLVGGETTTAEIFDVAKNAWSAAGTLVNPRFYHTTTILPDGHILLVGGRTTGSSYATPQANLMFADDLVTGTKCTLDGDCHTGVCSDGVCCDRACNGACEACAEPGSVGTCKIISGAPRAGHASCGGSGACAATCGGTLATCTFPDTSVSCVAPSCAGGVSHPGAKCDGAGACGALLPTVDCAPYVCDATACKTSCTSEADCVSTHTCIGGTCQKKSDPSMGTPSRLPEKPAVQGEFTRCVHSSDCPSGHCVEGVCCDTACTDRCHSCALLSSPGKCTPEPIGVDLKNECGAATQCLGTCDGQGACIGAVTGTMCARNRCIGTTTGIGPAYCPAPGATCAVDETVPFDCAPYTCDPAFGACLSQCKDSFECANGFVCDVPSHTCVPSNAPSDDGGGCAATPRSARNTAGLTAIALAVALLRARRRYSR